MKTLEKLKKDVLAGGVIDAADVKKLENALCKNGSINTEEVYLLFELNNAVSGKANAPEWKAFFINTITSFVLDNDQSDDIVDDERARYVYDLIKGDVQIDSIERELLENIKAKSKSFPMELAALLYGLKE